MALFIIWDLVVRFGLVKPILLPSPANTLITLIQGFSNGTLLLDFGVTVLRTVEAFFDCSLCGYALGHCAGQQ